MQWFGTLFIGLCVFLSGCLAQTANNEPVPLPAEFSWVTDQANVLSDDQKKDLRQKLKSFRDEVGSEICVVILPTTNGESIESYAHRLGSKWKPGRKNVGDGAILIIATEDHRMRLDVMRDLEGIVPDVVASRILDTMKPHLREGNYYKAVETALNALFTRIRTGDLPAPQKANDDDEDGPLWDEPWIAVGFIGFVITMMLRELLGRKSAVLAAGIVGLLGAFIYQSIVAGLVTAAIVVTLGLLIPDRWLQAAAQHAANVQKGTNTRNRRYRGHRNDGFGGGFGGGFDSGFGSAGGFGGGDSSGGGGDSGGGGASGGW